MSQTTKQKRIYQFKWKDYDTYSAQKIDISIHFHLLQSYDSELETMNTHKLGRKFNYPNVLFVLFALLKYIFHLSYRALPKLAKQFPKPYCRQVPHYTTIHRRIQNLDLEHYLPRIDFTGKNVAIALDSTGLKLYAYGTWLQNKHGATAKVRKPWIKLHLCVDTDTHTIFGIEITDEKIGDSKKAIELIKQACSKTGSVYALYGDGAYDLKDIFQFCSRKRVDPIIRVRKNASTRARGCVARANVVRDVQSLGEKQWKKKKRYGKRWAVERVYSMFKHFFGEYVCSRNLEHICTEIRQKCVILNYYLKELHEIKW